MNWREIQYVALWPAQFTSHIKCLISPQGETRQLISKTKKYYNYLNDGFTLVVHECCKCSVGDPQSPYNMQLLWWHSPDECECLEHRPSELRSDFVFKESSFAQRYPFIVCLNLKLYAKCYVWFVKRQTDIVERTTGEEERKTYLQQLISTKFYLQYIYDQMIQWLKL